MTQLDEARIRINQIDEEMANLFEERMQTVKLVAEYKKKNNLPILDASREKTVLERNKQFINDKKIEEFYLKFLQYVMDLSKDFQVKENAEN